MALRRGGDPGRRLDWNGEWRRRAERRKGSLRILNAKRVEMRQGHERIRLEADHVGPDARALGLGAKNVLQAAVSGPITGSGRLGEATDA